MHDVLELAEQLRMDAHAMRSAGLRKFAARLELAAELVRGSDSYDGPVRQSGDSALREPVSHLRPASQASAAAGPA